MKKILLLCIATLALAAGSGSLLAQGRGGMSGGGMSGGGFHSGNAGGAPSGGWQGGGNWQGGGWHNNGWHGGTSVGVVIGGPGLWWGGWPYYYPYASYPYGAPYADYAPQPPAEYVEQAPVNTQAFYWYYCTDPAGYYPYVQNCNAAWMQVVPQPAP